MGRRDKELIEGVVVEGVAAEGKAIAHIDGKALFIQLAIPGDVVDVQVVKKNRNYMEGYVKRMVTPSPDRLEPFCEHYGVCGGCKWQPLPYPLQLRYKQQQVEDQLRRIGHLDLPELQPIVPSELTQCYRNKLDYTFSDRRWVFEGEDPAALFHPDEVPNTNPAGLGLGFHISGAFDKVLDLRRCHLQPEPSNAIRNFVREYAVSHGLTFFNLRQQVGYLRNLIIRTTEAGHVMVIAVFSREDGPEDEAARRGLLDALRERFPEIRSLYYIINRKRNDSVADQQALLYAGDDAVYEEMEGIRFKIGPKSFYQTNSRQAYRLYSVVRDFAGLTGSESVYDLYTGTGTIAIFLARQASRVIGIEYVPEAIEDARVNAEANGINNCTFYAGDMKDILTADFIARHGGTPDVMVLDPPRAGIHGDVAKVILDAAPRKIVYVSCNPATQARDLALLSAKYDITAVRPVDMFPHTHHVENVAALTLRG